MTKWLDFCKHYDLNRVHQSFRPAKYSEMVPYTQILFIALMDFAKTMSADFSRMSTEDRVRFKKKYLKFNNYAISAHSRWKQFPIDPIARWIIQS